MTGQRPTDEADESIGHADKAVQTEQTQPRPVLERFFTNDVIDAAERHNWRTFHLRDRDSIHIVRGKGFPDLIMFREDPATGETDLLAAELKRDAQSVVRPEQEEWLAALGQHILTRTWRPEDWDEIEDVLRNGTSGHMRSPIQKRLSVRNPVPANFGTVIQDIIEAIEDRDMSTGNRASLRRMEYSNPNCAVFWKLISHGGISRNADIRKWGLITHGIALMSHNGTAHNPTFRIGRTLYEGDGNNMPFYSNDRLATLLSARGDTLHRLLARLFRMLGSRGCAFNWRDMAWFILNEGYNEERADQARIEIARAYYQAERRSS